MCDDCTPAPISEAKVAGIKQFRVTMADFMRQLGDWRSKSGIFYTLLRQMREALLQSADSEGNIRDGEQQRLRGRIDALVTRIFVGEDGRNAYGQDGVTPLAPYPALLNEYYVRVVVEAVLAQRNWLYRNAPEDVYQWLASGARSGVNAEAYNVIALREQLTREEVEALRIFHPNPLAEIDPSRQWVPMHQWQDPNGYRLSDRIWRTSNETRQSIDRLLARGLADGRGALALSDALEAYLIPGQEGVRTLRPYGEFTFKPGGASAWAMRLARTEIARAANQASYVSAYLNPYVNKIDVARSSNGMRKFHNCHELATLGFSGERIREAYSVHSAILPPYHPNCMCYTVPVTVDTPATVTNNLRSLMQDARRDVLSAGVTPVQADALLQMLLHRALGGIVGQFRGQILLPGF